jgi:hypothetical protein
MKTRLFAVITAVTALAGCVTNQTQEVSVMMSVPTPDDRVMAFKSPADGPATLTVIRDRGFIGGGCYLAFYVNKTLAARMDPGERVDLAVPAGELLLGVSRDKQGRGLCSLGGHLIQRETVMKAGERKVFRISTNGDGNYDVFRSQE